jgi:VWFA-related protein
VGYDFHASVRLNNPMRPTAALIVAGLVWSAQTQQPPIFRGGVDVVQIEFSVLDRDRRPVHGLAAKDFSVLEDGKPQTIVDVHEVLLNDDEPAPVWAHAVTPDVASNDFADRRLIAIVMDDAHCCAPANGSPNILTTDGWAVGHAIETARAIVNGLGPKDLAVVVPTRELAVLDRFSNDRDTLYAAISRFRPITESGCRPVRPSSVLRDLRALMAASPQPLKSIIVLTSLASINYSLILPCPAPTYVVPDTGRVVTYMPMPSEKRDADESLTANVPIYTLNVSGLIVGSDPSRRSSPMRVSGPNLTGGTDFLHTNDLGPAAAQILAENTSYYRLGFRTSRPTVDGHYRRLEVRVLRPGEHTVRTRRGYYRPRPPAAPGKSNDRELTPLPPGVAKALPSFDVTLQAAVAAFATATGAALAVTVDVAHPLLDALPSGGEELELRIVAYESGAVKHDQRSRVRVAPVAGASRLTATVQSILALAPGRYQLWLTARDPRTSRLGSVFHDIDVPDFATRAITISGVALGAPPPEGAVIPAALAAVVPIVPVASRIFATSEDVDAFLRIYQRRGAPPAPVALRVRILDAKGATVFTRDETLPAERFAERHAADYSLRLPLQTLATGEHLLTIEAQQGDRISPKRDVIFTVR